MSRPFGWDLPPGCSTHDVDRAFAGDDPQPESEEVCELMEGLQPGEQCLLAARDRIVEIVDGLAIEKSAMRDLLERARAYLPARGPEPPCTCKVPLDVSNSPVAYCERHDTDWDEPTLLEEVENLLKEPTDEPG